MAKKKKQSEWQYDNELKEEKDLISEAGDKDDAEDETNLLDDEILDEAEDE